MLSRWRARAVLAVVAIAALLAVVAGVAVGGRAWIGDDGAEATPRTLAEFRPAMMTIYDGERGSRAATDAAGIERATPFRILLPTYVPRGYTLQVVQVSRAIAGSTGRVAEVGTSVLMTFAPGSRAPGFGMEQLGAVAQFEPTVGVTVNGAAAHAAEIGPAQSRGRVLQWNVCDRGIVLTAGVSLALDELVRVAESVRGEC